MDAYTYMQMNGRSFWGTNPNPGGASNTGKVFPEKKKTLTASQMDKGKSFTNAKVPREPI